jgi:ATP-dependent metalloprotease FtsH
MSDIKQPKKNSPIGGNQKKKDGKGKKPFNFYWIYAIVGLILISINLFNAGSSLSHISPSEFRNMVEQGDINRVMVYNEKFAEVYVRQDRLTSEPHSKKIKNPMMGEASSKGPHYIFEIGPGKEEFSANLQRWNKEFELEYDFKTRDEWGKEIFQWIIFLVIMIAIWMFVMRKVGGGGGGPGGQLFNIGKSKAQLFDKGKSTNTNFNDVAGLEGAKEEIQEIVDFLKSPEKYTELGAKIPKGALLVGPPGTGKTLLAKAVAGEAQVPFFSLSGSDFVEMFVGVGASRVRDLFKQAKEKSPSIIFIDEIDAIGKARGKNASYGSNDERENTLNQLLTEMDGFGTNSGVIILAATNRADVLDRALMRAGRFDRQIYVDMPDLNERKEIFEVHLKPLKLEVALDVEFLARQTPGFSGADIANICNEAALIAARKKKKAVEKQDFLDAVDRIVGGLEKKNKLITQDEKRSIAFHEAGHATISWLLEHAHPLVKVTIVPRGQSLGAAWYLPDERSITTTEQLLDEMCSALGGRAAEKIMFNKISTGALSDLEKVTKQAYAMVKIYGLNDKIGNISYYDSQQSEYGFTKPYSENTAQIIDEEVKGIIDNQYDRALKLLEENREKLIALADKLLEDEVIFKEDLVKIFGERPFASIVREFTRKPKTVVEEETETIAIEAAESNDTSPAKESEKETELPTETKA